ncbi:MAG: glycosyltransferase [Proteobacteria bacterium]|nr:glycosyltransferase [Pseudomonadota bacterium]
MSRYLFCTWEGGGHVPPMITVARRLAARGHEVTVLSDAANRGDVADLGFRTWRRAPNRADKRSESDPVREWEPDNPAGVLQRLLDGVMAGPALAYAQDTLEALDDLRPEVVVSQELLFGVMAAAEAAALPLALFTTNAWSFPDPLQQPPFGTGFPPAETEADRTRDGMVRAVTRQLFDAGRPALNAAREAVGLQPLPHLLDQLEAADRVLLGVSRAWDFPTAAPPPERFRYIGPVVEDPSWTAGWSSPWAPDDPRPLVVVSFSTFFQGQTDQIRRAIEALTPLPVRAVVTLGPALDPADFAAPEHVLVVQSASHDALIPQASLLVTHAGHGTAVRAIRHGVPVLAIPMGRDQADNASRMALRGAGLRLDASATAGAVRGGIQAILGDPGYARAADALGEVLRTTGDVDAVEELEALAQASPQATPAAREV